MTYRNPDHALRPALDQLIEGCDAFWRTSRRIISSDDAFERPDINEVMGLSNELATLELRLRDLRRRVW